MQLTLFSASILCFLMLQFTGYSLVRRIGSKGGHEWTPAGVLLGGEIMKMLISLGVSFRHSTTDESRCAKLVRLTKGAPVLLPPALLYESISCDKFSSRRCQVNRGYRYVAMNILSYWALARIDTTAFSILTQLKIVATAIMLKVSHQLC